MCSYYAHEFGPDDGIRVQGRHILFRHLVYDFDFAIPPPVFVCSYYAHEFSPDDGIRVQGRHILFRHLVYDFDSAIHPSVLCVRIMHTSSARMCSLSEYKAVIFYFGHLVYDFDFAIHPSVLCVRIMHTKNGLIRA